MNEIAKAAFSIAEVTFEVRARYGCIMSEIEVTLDHIALEGTKQMRPDTVKPFRSVAAHLAFCGQGRG